MSLALATAALSEAGCEKYRDLDAVEAVLQSANAAPGEVEDDAAGSRGYRRVARLFVAPTATALLGPEPVSVDQGETLPFVLDLAAGDCVTAVAHSETDGADIDLRLDSPDGQPVAVDASPDPFPVIPDVCVSAAGAYTLRLSSARGSADAWVGAYGVVGDTADAARVLATLADRYVVGGRALGPVAAESVVAGRVARVPVALGANECVAIVAFGGAGVEDLDLVVVDGDDAIVARDIGVDASPVIPRLCAPAAGAAYYAELRPYAGSGTAWWRTLGVPR